MHHGGIVAPPVFLGEAYLFENEDRYTDAREEPPTIRVCHGAAGFSQNCGIATQARSSAALACARMSGAMPAVAS